VYALCLRLTADAREAEELTQDAFVRAWERLGSFRGESAFASWLYRLTVNVVFMSRRTTRRRAQRVFATEDPGALERPAEDARRTRARPRSRAGGRGAAARAREIFVLYDVKDMGTPKSPS